MKDSDISSIVQLRFWQHIQGGTLTVMPALGGEDVGINIRRVFSLTDVPVGGVRGDHAHKYCTQVLMCLHGKVSVGMDDGRSTCNVVLENPEQGLSIPPGIWNRIVFEEEDSVLVVFCDQTYDPGDYMRDREEYLKYKEL